MSRLLIDVWRHPSGRTVSLVGTIHVAPAAYYAAATRAVNLLVERGAEVHCEGTRGLRPDDDATPDERDLLARLAATDTGGYARLAKLLGLVTQGQALRRQPGWVNADISVLELLRAQRHPERLVRVLEEIDGLVEILESGRFPIIVALLRWVVLRAGLLIRMATVLPMVGPIDRAVDRKRNAVAARAALKAAGDVVAIWGAAHLPGIGAHLASAGFRRIKRVRLAAS